MDSSVSRILLYFDDLYGSEEAWSSFVECLPIEFYLMFFSYG